jgi:competence protein ComEC
MSRSNLFLGILFILLIIRWYFFGGYFLFEENISLLSPMQNYLVSICNQIMPEPQSSLLAGILIGEKQSLDPDFKKALINTSTIHIVVVSGQNLSMLAGFLMAFSPWFGRKKTVLITITILTGYSILTGLQLPVIRAALMSIFSLSGLLFNREINAVKILIFSGQVMLIANPTWLDSISFQLSFMATFGVMVLAPEIIKADKWLPDFIRQDLWVSLSAQLLTLPIIAINFHRVSIVGLLSNMLVLWTIGPVMITGIIAVLVSLFSPFLGAIFGFVPSLLLFYFTKVIEITNQSWSSLLIPYFTGHFWVGYYITFIGIYLFFKAKNDKTDSKNINQPRVKYINSPEYRGA